MQGRRAATTPETVSLDRGCRFRPRCVTCPFAHCILELPARERAEFVTAWRVVLRHVEPASARPG
jgi:hypothetical protein